MDVAEQWLGQVPEMLFWIFIHMHGMKHYLLLAWATDGNLKIISMCDWITASEKVEVAFILILTNHFSTG